MKIYQNIVGFLLKFRWFVIVLLLVLSALSGVSTLKNLRVDNSLAIWFLEDNPAYNAYINYQNEFGSDEVFIGMMPVENALDSVSVNKLTQLHQKLDSLWFVNTTFSLAKAQYPIYSNGKIILESLYNPQRSEKALKNLMSKMSNISNQLLTEDGKNLFFYIQLKPTPVIEGEREIILPMVETYFNEVFGEDYHLSGAPVLNEAYSRGIYKESLIFAALTIAVIALMLLFLLPDRRYLLLALLAVITPVSLLFGIITSFGFALNMISMLIPTILLVYSVSDAVHIINIYQKEGLLNPTLSRKKLIALAFRKSLTPCFYTTLTTIVGYFALYLSPLPAFKNMGVLTCLGLLLCFVLVYVIVIIGLSFYQIDFKTSKPFLKLPFFNTEKLVNKLNIFTTSRQNGIILVSFALMLFGVYAIMQVKTDTTSLNLLAEGKAKQDLRLIESQLGSSSRLQINIHTPSEGDLFLDETIRSLENFQSQLEFNPMLSAPVSVLTIKDFLEQRTPALFQSNVDKSKLESAMVSYNDQNNAFFTFFSKDLRTIGITVGVKELKTSELETLIKTIESDFKSSFDQDKFQLEIQGFSVVFSQLNRFILQTQFRSFFAAFIVGFLALLFFIKNLRTTILVLIPNVLPLLILAIAMWLLSIPLDVTTAMITPIMLGIAMDDTIHLIYKYKRTKAIKGNPQERIDKSMRYTGGALLSTTIALVAGFLIISTSAVPSVSEFGLLCALTILVALITDVLFLPALLKRFDK